MHVVVVLYALSRFFLSSRRRHTGCALVTGVQTCALPIFVAVVTPMFPDGAVDWDSLSALVEWHIAEGTDGIVAVGTTGESATLNVDEHTEVIRRVVKLSKQRVPIIAGTGEIGSASCRERVGQYA